MQLEGSKLGVVAEKTLSSWEGEATQEKGKRRAREAGRRIRKGWGRLLFGLAVGASLGQLQLPPGFFPFGPAFCGAWLKSGLRGGFVVFLITIFSLYSRLRAGVPGEEFTGRVFLYLPVLLGIHFVRRRKRPLAYGIALMLPVTIFLMVRFIADRYRLEVFPGLSDGLGEILLLYLLIFALSPGIGFLFSPVPRAGKNKEILFSLAVLAVTVFFSLGQAVDLSSWLKIPFAGDLFFAFLLIFLTTKRYGTGAGTIVAVVFGGVEVLFGEGILLRLVLITGSGLAAGLGYEFLKKRYGFVLGFLIHMALVTARWWDAPGLEEL